MCTICHESPCSRLGQGHSESQSSSASKTITLKRKAGTQSDRTMDVKIPAMAQVSFCCPKHTSWPFFYIQLKSWKDKSLHSPGPPSFTLVLILLEIYIFLMSAGCAQGNSVCPCLHLPPLFLPAQPWPPDLDCHLLLLCFHPRAITVTPPNLASRMNVITSSLVILPRSLSDDG